MGGPADLLWSVLVPALLAGLVLLVSWGARSTAPAPARGRTVGALALGLATLAAYAHLFGAPVVPSAERVLAARDWVPWIVALAMLAYALALVPRLGDAIALAAPPLLLALLVWLSLRPLLARSLGLVELAAVVAGLALAWASAEALARRVRGASVPAVLWVAVGAASAAAVLQHLASVAQLAGGLAGGLGAAVVLAWRNPRLSLAGGGVAVALLVLGALLVNAVYYATLPPLAAELALLALLTPWLAHMPWFDALGPRSKVAVRAALAAMPAGAAVAVAYGSQPEPYEH